MQIQIEKADKKFKVTVDNKQKTEHLVELDEDYYEKLTKKKISREELIKKAFQFLLRRESNQSILKEFNLKTINSYFPEFEEEVGK